MFSPQVTSPGMRGWVEETTRAATRDWQPLLAGNSRELWAAELVDADRTAPIVVRIDQGDGPMSGTVFDLVRESAVYQALNGRGLRMPELLAHDDRRMVLSRLPGDSEWTDSVLDDLLTELARLHTIPTDELALPGFARTAEEELDLWTRVAARSPADPLVDTAFDVLRTCFPGEPERLVFCHGDVGPGNVLHRDGSLTGLLDWEFAHLGDPMDDLAWITVRARLNGLQLPDFARRVREHYAPAAGVRLEPHRFRYWQAVVLLRNLVCCRAGIAQPEGADKLLYLMLVPALRAMLVQALADITHTVLVRPATAPTELRPPPSGPLPGADALREITTQLSILADELSGEHRQRVKRMRLLLRQVSQAWSLVPTTAEPHPDEPRLQRYADDAARQLAVFPWAARMAAAPLPDLVSTSVTSQANH